MKFPYQQPLPHYYGDMTRILFIAIGIIMLLGLPEMTRLLNLPVAYPIIGVVVVGISAGFTNPKQHASLLLNVIVSVIGLISFIYISWFMRSQSLYGFMLFLNQLIAVLFLITLYLSTKSLRGYSGS